MRHRTSKIADSRPLRAVLCAAALLLLAACQEEIHSAQWYMGNAKELQAKLGECKKYPSLNTSDQNCKNAGEAFAMLISASTGQDASAAQERP